MCLQGRRELEASEGVEFPHTEEELDKKASLVIILHLLEPKGRR
jgi:hypothetical protein